MGRELLGGIESLGHWPLAFQLTMGMRQVSVSVFPCFRVSVFPRFRDSVFSDSAI